MAKKMTIEEAAKHFGVSKEAIHNRIRRGSLTSKIENGVKYVLVDPNIQKPTQKTSRSTTAIEFRFHSFLEEQNKELQARIEKLEQETRRLREEKERLLIEERKRIEQIYKEKDEQLKNILNAISSKFLLEAKPLHNEETLEAEIEEQTPKKKKKKNLVLFEKLLDKADLSQKKKDKLIKKVRKLSKKEERFILKKDKIYLDLHRYSYTDIF